MQQRLKRPSSLHRINKMRPRQRSPQHGMQQPTLQGNSQQAQVPQQMMAQNAQQFPMQQNAQAPHLNNHFPAAYSGVAMNQYGVGIQPVQYPFSPSHVGLDQANPQMPLQNPTNNSSQAEMHKPPFNRAQSVPNVTYHQPITKRPSSNIRFKLAFIFPHMANFSRTRSKAEIR